MHEPRPHGRFGAKTQEDAAAAELLARKLTNFKAASGLASLKLARTLPSGAMAIAVDAGGILRVIIQNEVEPQQQQFASDGLAKSFLPMMFSGVVTSGRVRHGEPVALRVTQMTRRRLGGYKNMDAPEYMQLQRFLVGIPEQLMEFEPRVGGENFFTTQYASCRPTWWSGAMAQLVQIVGGYGNQDRDNLPDTPLERARMGVPERVQKDIERELGNTRLPGYTGFPPRDGKFAFDYKFNSTHAVGFDDRQRPWLLRISTVGVYAMPLPLIPATTTQAFRVYVEGAGDDELLWALDRFGGLPSGEGFPRASADFEAWRRAGVITKVCDAGDFYRHYMYASAMGWSVNARGSEGVNTCFTLDEGTGITYGLAYKLRLRLASATADGNLPDELHLDDEDQQKQLNGYLSRLYQMLTASNHENLAIKYKLRRAGAEAILARAHGALGQSMQAEGDYWRNLELPPIAAHSGSITQFARGPLPWRIAEFKFPEPLMEGCISFESADRPPLGTALPRCDTIVTAYYTGSTMKVLKFFQDERKYKQAVQSNEDACMTVGSWQRIATEGEAGLQGSLYCTDFDDRQSVADSETVTDIVGRDLGYDHTPWFSYDEFFWRPGTIWRNRYFRHDTKMVTTNSKRISLAMCMPWFDRNAVLYARQENTAGKRYIESIDLYSIRDPYSYRYWTHDDVWAWIGGVSGQQSAVPVYPRDGNPVWVVQENYSPGLCSDFADQGSWIGLPADYTWLVHPERGRWDFNGGGGAPKLKVESITRTEPASTQKLLQLSSLEQPSRVHTNPESTYWLLSPDPYVGIFYRDAVKVVAGEAEYANVSESHPQRPGERFFQGWSRIADNKAAHHFIGVINE